MWLFCSALTRIEKQLIHNAVPVVRIVTWKYAQETNQITAHHQCIVSYYEQLQDYVFTICFSNDERQDCNLDLPNQEKSNTYICTSTFKPRPNEDESTFQYLD
jgi:hypothetical protein